jgi:hypothetical protein
MTAFLVGFSTRIFFAVLMGHKSSSRSWTSKGASESEITYPTQAGKSHIFVLKTEILMSWLKIDPSFCNHQSSLITSYKQPVC